MNTCHSTVDCWTTWDVDRWKEVSLGGLAYFERTHAWSLKQDGKGRSLLMAMLEDQADPVETVRLIGSATQRSDWLDCLALEDQDGVRLPAYVFRYATENRFSHGAWADNIAASPVPLSSRGHGILRQLASLARRSDNQSAWIVDHPVVAPKNSTLSCFQWQAGLDEDLVLDWFCNRLFAANDNHPATISGPATPDMHFFYGFIVEQHGHCDDEDSLSSWKFGLQEGIWIAQHLGHSPDMPAADQVSARQVAKERWAAREAAVDRLWPCFEHGGGVMRAMLKMYEEVDIWDVMIDRVRSGRIARDLSNALPPEQVDADTETRRL